MKLTLIARVVALSAFAAPCLAQVTAPQAGSAAPKGSFAALIPLLKTMHSLSGSNLSPKEKVQVAARMATINDLTKAGTEAMRLKNFVVAEADFRELIQVDSSPYNYYGLGEALAGEGKTADALAAYKTAVDWPLNRDPQAIALSQAMGGSTSNLRGCCGPADAIAWMKYALLLTLTGQETEARARYMEAARLLPGRLHPEAALTADDGTPVSTARFQSAVHLALGVMGSERDGGEQNMTEFEQALKLAPDSAAANYYYGYGWKRLDLQSKTRLADAPVAKAALQKAAQADDAAVKKAAGDELRGL